MKSLLKEGRAPDCFLSRVVQDEKMSGVPSEEEAAYLALMLVLGGSDTVSLPKLKKAIGY